MMAGRLLRRSGVAIVQVAEFLGWTPDVIFQAGVGVYSKETEVFKEAWPEVRLCGWEAHPEIYTQLVGDNLYPGTLIEKALGEKQGEILLYYVPAHMDGASRYPYASNSRCQAIWVQVNTLDDELSPHWNYIQESRALLWLDCEGSELSVLKGAENALDHIDVINIEMTGVPPAPGWPTPVEVNRWLMNRGFLCQYIHTHRTSAGQNDMVYVTPKLFKPEYCSCPLQIETYLKEKK